MLYKSHLVAHYFAPLENAVKDIFRENEGICQQCNNDHPGGNNKPLELNEFIKHWAVDHDNILNVISPEVKTHLNLVFPDEDIEDMDDEEFEEFLNSKSRPDLINLCKVLKINFKNYKRNTYAEFLKKRKKYVGSGLRRCGTCANCAKNDCGTCDNCKEMPKFGGPKQRYACMHRIPCLRK